MEKKRETNELDYCDRVTMTIPSSMLRRLDRKRGDVSRSRYMLRLIEKHLARDA